MMMFRCRWWVLFLSSSLVVFNENINVQAFRGVLLHRTYTTGTSTTKRPSCVLLLGAFSQDSNNKNELPAYNDGWLFQKHMEVQNERIVTTNSLTVWNEQQELEQEQIREWQDSFQRNGLADFTPPMSYGLNCLMVGGDCDGGQDAKNPYKNTKLPWEEESEADITALRVLSPEVESVISYDLVSLGPAVDSDPAAIRTVMVSSSQQHQPTMAAQSSSAGTLGKTPKEAAVYDCIVDQGLLGAVFSTDDTQAVRDLLLEAATALREHGIYVLTTQNMSAQDRALLEEYSQEAGLEWEFELDGISDDAGQVSVARRFNNGAMPKVGKLSRYQPT